MKKFGSKQLIPIATAIFGIVFAYIGITKLGFWEKEPQPGFFPTIFSVVMVVASIAAFFQTLKEEEGSEYNKNELMVICGGLSLIVGTMIVGLIPMVFLFVLFWLKVVEKGVSWKHILIIEVIVGIIVVGVFATWLQVQFPWGLLEWIM